MVKDTKEKAIAVSVSEDEFCWFKQGVVRGPMVMKVWNMGGYEECGSEK